MAFLLAILVVLPCARAQQRGYVDYLPSIEASGRVEMGLFHGKSASFDELSRESFTSPADVLRYLIRSSPDLARSFVLVHSSQSLQPSSLEHPRVIVFGGGRAFAFTDHPAQKVPRVEIMEIDRSTYEISLREIRFENGRAKFDRQPASCVACHGAPAKPLWNPYDFWPHAFASAIGLVASTQERDAYAALRARSGGSTVMSQLEWPARLDLDSEDVTAFTEFVHQANLARWVKQNLGSGVSLRGYEKALAAVTSGCTADPLSDRRTKKVKFLELFRAEERAGVGALYDSIEKDAIESRNAFKASLDAVAVRVFPNATPLFKIDHSRLGDEAFQMAQVRTLFALAGVDVMNLSTSLVANDTLISAPSNALIDFGTALFIHEPGVHAGLPFRVADLYTGRPGFVMVDCESTKKESLKASRAPVAPVWSTFRQVHRSQPVVSRCAKCHVDHLADSPLARAPAIPFDQPLRMMELVRKGNLGAKISARIRSVGSAGQMPPDHPLTPAEIAALEAYVDALK